VSLTPPVTVTPLIETVNAFEPKNVPIVNPGRRL
jgi:hypothetical protein